MLSIPIRRKKSWLINRFLDVFFRRFGIYFSFLIIDGLVVVAVAVKSGWGCGCAWLGWWRLKVMVDGLGGDYKKRLRLISVVMMESECGWLGRWWWKVIVAVAVVVVGWGGDGGNWLWLVGVVGSVKAGGPDGLETSFYRSNRFFLFFSAATVLKSQFTRVTNL